jgi:uncharacterized membrane protein YjfL (UPF0719 family)
LVRWIIFGENNNSWSSTFCSFLQCSITKYAVSPLCTKHTKHSRTCPNVALKRINNAEASLSLCLAILVVVTCLRHALAQTDGLSEAYKCSCNPKAVWALPTSFTWMNTAIEHSSVGFAIPV